MKTTETVLASATRIFTAPRGYNGSLYVTAKAYRLGGNPHPHFSVTGEIATPKEKARGDAQCAGCIHDEILQKWPAIKPVVAMHLANADDGEPMHGESNGFYWLAGALGGLGEQYHGGSGDFGKSPDECLRIFADHIRVSLEEAQSIARSVQEVFNDAVKMVATSEEVTDAAKREQSKAGNKAAKADWHVIYSDMLPRFKQEAQDALAILKAL